MAKKKKRRRYKINWNVLVPDFIANRKRPRRRLRKPVIFGGLAIILLLLGIWLVPPQITNSKLKKLGYNKSEITEIKELKLTKTILNNAYYSEALAKALLDKTLNTDYLPLYLAVDGNRTLTDEDFLLYARLEDKGYETDQIQNLFKNLEDFEIIPLLIFDYQYNENTYIDDCKANRDHNSQDSFSLTNSYVTYYEKAKDITNAEDLTALVTKNKLVPESYVPTDLTEIDSNFSVDGLQLRKEAAESFTAFATNASSNGARIYAVLGYRSYEDQQSAYNSLSLYSGEEYALTHAAKPGASEHQTGLSVNVAVVGQESEDFETTTSGQWALQNCSTYGFIERYPKGKEYLTGFTAETDHFRYVGKQLAQEITASKLTFDEFYALYLDSWSDESFKPAKSVLDNAYPAISTDKDQA